MARATGKDYAQVKLDIWGDDDWLDLSPPAQHLYFVLWTSPGLSYCGTGEWHPGRISTKARGWTPDAVDAAALELAREMFLLIDLTTEEYILRSWIKHDGLWKQPTMAVSMANARAALASRPLRGVIVHEVSKLKARQPDCTSWCRDAVVDLLKQNPVDPATLPPYPGYPGLNPTVDPSPHPYANPPVNGQDRASVNPPPDPGPTPSPAPTSITPTPTGTYVTGERHQATTDDSNAPPPRYCPKHRPSGTLDPCAACGDTRRAFDTWQATASIEQKRTEQARARDEATQRVTETTARAHRIAQCPLCDDDGYQLNGGTVCDHIDRTETNRNGMAAVRAALGKPQELDQ